MHRLLSIDMAKHAAERLDIGRKSRASLPSLEPVSIPVPDPEKDKLKYHILRSFDTQLHDVGFCDSVRLIS
jgi:hypothetical protein